MPSHKNSPPAKGEYAEGGRGLPKLRFPEFQNARDWQERTLSEILHEHGLKSSGKEEVFSVSVHKGLINQIEHLGRRFAAASTDHYNRVLPGDIVYTKSPTGDFPLGIIKQSKVTLPVIVSPLYGVFTPETTALGTILDAYFASPENVNNYLSSIVKKGAKNTINITNKTFLSKSLVVPVNKAEQQKIADCLTSLDEVISAEAQKLDALKAHKKGLMQQLFPAEGETVPKRRFPEFRDSGEWEVRTLGDLVEIRSGLSPSSYALSKSGKHPFLKVEDLNNCEKYQRSSREYSNNDENVIPSRSIIFPKRGAAISLNKLRINIAPVLMDTNLMAITPNEAISSEFLFYQILSIGLSEIADNSTIPQINNKHIIPYQVKTPTNLEQMKIADCLSALDELIAAQAAKIEALKAQKKGLMQGLFPQQGSSE